MPPLPRIADSEWTVMQALWERSPRTANDVVDALADSVTWSPRTVKTLLNRLVTKGALGYTQKGRVYHYYPKVDEADCVRAERDSFLKRVYGGSLTPMLAQFIEDEDLTPEEIQQLKAILDKKRRSAR